MLPAPSPFLLGIEDVKASRKTVRLLEETGAAGVLLLARNLRSPRQTRKLIRELSQAAGRPLIFSIDHEGGWVQRFRHHLTSWPGNAALGRAGRPDWARQAGRTMAGELAQLGIGLNLAPVADIQGAAYNPGIGIRSFGGYSEIVYEMSIQFICGHNDHKIASCIKHFPGKGEAAVDAHIDLPTIRAPKSRLLRVHIAPFARAIAAGVPSLMTTHASYPALDPSLEMATFSRPIAHDLLRKKLGFQGLLISDDLGMGAIVRRGTPEQASVKALAAGHDLLIIAESQTRQRAAAEAVARALDDGLLDPVRWRRTRLRLRDFCARYALSPSGALPRPAPGLPLKIARAAVDILREGRVSLPLRHERRRLIEIFFPDFAQIDAQFAFEGGPHGPERLLRRLLSRWGSRLSCNRTGVTRPARIPPAPKEADLAVFFCFDALKYPAQAAALANVERTRKNLVAVLLRNPWDIRLLGSGATALTARGFRDCQLRALAEALA